MTIKKWVVFLGVLLTLVFNGTNMIKPAAAAANVAIKINELRIQGYHLQFWFNVTNIGDEPCTIESLQVEGLKVITTWQGYDENIYDGSVNMRVLGKPMDGYPDAWYPERTIEPGQTMTFITDGPLVSSPPYTVKGDLIRWTADSYTPIIAGINTANGQGDETPAQSTTMPAKQNQGNNTASGSERFTWRDFLHNGVQPDIDVNWLIGNVWRVEPVDTTNGGAVYNARFVPFIWENLGENKRTVKTLVLTKIYDAENGNCCNYIAEAHAYDGKKVTFDCGDFIVNMDSDSIPHSVTGNVNRINCVNMDGAQLRTTIIHPEPMTFHQSFSKPESFLMDDYSQLWNYTITLRFTRIK